MTVGVAGQNFMFAVPERQSRPVPPRVKIGDARPQNLNIPKVPLLAAPKHAPREQDNIIWSYNPLHDMESIFWICVFYILFRGIHCGSTGAALSSDREGILGGKSEETRQN